MLEQGIEFYFADAYAAWQRGTNENANGRIREFFPKKTHFNIISDLEVFSAEIQLLSKVSQ